MMLSRKKKLTETQGPLPRLQLAREEIPAPDVFLDTLTRTMGHFGFQQILLPPLEERRTFKHPELSAHFADQMVMLEDGDREAVWAPTYLLSVLKRYLQNYRLRGPHVSKWFHLSPVVRQTATGRKTFHELGLFVMGEDSPLASCQIINTVGEILRELGVPEFVTELNSLGCRACQKNYKEVFENHLERGMSDLCEQCQEKFERRVTAMWDCQNASCQEIFAAAPQIVDSLDTACKANLMGVLENIDALAIPYTLNPILNAPLITEKLAFRMSTPDLKDSVVGTGGNYGFWAQASGHSESLPVLGFQTTFERLWESIPEERRRTGPKVDVFMVPLAAAASRRAMIMHRDLQHSGIATAEAMLGNASIKNQLKEAVAKRCEIALIIGQKEALDETVILRDMRSGMQEVMSSDRIIEEVKKRLGK